uniref:(northern house mosquito) hypothetical protein n=1 Tax=Culex pipiens TaxID=7175 RepID=A0A8D8A2G9_CULPI
MRAAQLLPVSWGPLKIAFERRATEKHNRQYSEGSSEGVFIHSFSSPGFSTITSDEDSPESSSSSVNFLFCEDGSESSAVDFSTDRWTMVFSMLLPSSDCRTW